MVMFMWKSVWYLKKINAVKSLAVKVTEIIIIFFVRHNVKAFIRKQKNLPHHSNYT